jgi:hypothetical protein
MGECSETVKAKRRAAAISSFLSAYKNTINWGGIARLGNVVISSIMFSHKHICLKK